ncbi:MAG: polyhydroxyalkanoate granule-associated phasin [Burkholderiales bacterium]|nr:hypothetical protein [Burkholderiales bacterium]
MDFQKSQRTLVGMMPSWCQTAFKMWEVGIAAPQIIAHRTARMAAAGQTPNARDQREFNRMGQEKLDAFRESWTAMAMQTAAFNMQLATQAAQQWFGAWTAFQRLMLAGTPVQMAKAQETMLRSMATSFSSAGNKQLSDSFSRIASKGLAPVHKTATANVRRLRGF